MSDYPKYIDQLNLPQEGKKTVARDTVQCIVHDKKTDTVLCLKWKNYDWQTFIVGGIDEGESPMEAALREIYEETGYKNLKYVGQLGDIVESHYFAAHKDENRIAYVRGVYFELENDEADDISEEEKSKAEFLWVPFSEIPDFVRGAEVHELWRRLNEGEIN